MTFLPVVERELRAAARRRQTYWTRFFAALIALALSTWIWGWLADGSPTHERGQIVFRVVSGMALAYSLLAGIWITSDCLSEEKREGTLGLLFLTDLGGYDVVFGKLAATSFNAAYRLISVFPILAIPLLLGAMTPGEFWRMALVLINTLFFSLAAGILISAISVQERRALAGTILLITLVTVGPPVLGLIAAVLDRRTPYNPDWLMTSAIYPGLLALDVRYQVSAGQFWSAVASTHVLAWMFFGLASVLVRQTWQDRPLGGWRALWQQRRHAWQFGQGAKRSALRRRLLDLNPVAWQAGRDRLRSCYVFTFLGAIGAIWLWLYHKYGSAMLDPTVYILTAYCAQTVLKLWVATEACRPLAEDRRSGALELLLSTPLGIREILEGELLALHRQFAWPVAAVLAADVAMMLAGVSDQGFDRSTSWPLLCLGLMTIFILDLYTLAWVGLWLSLRAKKANRAAAGAIARVLVLPWALLIFGLSFLAAVRWPGFETGDLGLFSAAFAIALATDLILMVWARGHLHRSFRLVATQRYASPALSEGTRLDAAPPSPVVPPALAR